MVLVLITPYNAYIMKICMISCQKIYFLYLKNLLNLKFSVFNFLKKKMKKKSIFIYFWGLIFFDGMIWYVIVIISFITTSYTSYT